MDYSSNKINVHGRVRVECFDKEKGVAIAKNLLRRCNEECDLLNFQYRILEYNTTPLASKGMTATELFFGRLDSLWRVIY